MSHSKLPALKFKVAFLILVSMLLSSVHAQATLTQNDISMLYVSIFNRASEGGGNAFWRTQPHLQTPTEAANAMLDTDAARNYFGNSLNSNQAFIEHIFLNTLNKTYSDDPGGIDYWVGELNKGTSRGEVVAAMVGVIKEYAPGGLYYINDPATIAAYNQFTNRVAVSDYMADTLLNPPADWQTVTQFGPGGLNVTFEAATVDTAKQTINIFAGSPAGLTDDIEYYMAMITSAGELSPMMDEISVLLGTILSEDSSVVVISPSLSSIDPYYPPSTIDITADFGDFGNDGYTPEGSTSVYTGSTVINITNISFAGTNLTANANLTATNVRRDGKLILNGNMSFGIDIGMAGGNTSVNANAVFSNLSSMDALINGSIALNIPVIDDNGQLTQPATLTLTQFATMDYQMNGTVTMSQTSTEIFEFNFNVTTNQGPVSGILSAQMNPLEIDQTLLSTPYGPMTVGNASVTINQVVVDSTVCEDLPASGNISITRGAESATISFGNCTYTVN